MNIHGSPDAEAITKLGKYWDGERWAGQKRVDDRNAQYLMLDNPIDVQKDANGRATKGFRSGIGLTVVKENAALTTVMPVLHFNIPDPEDEKAKEHADGTLEPWCEGAWAQAQQAGDVWTRLSFDIHGFGRAWDNILPHPHLWATPAFEELVGEMNESTDPDERREKERELRLKKAGVWPVRWTYVSPRCTWTTFDSEFWLPEVIEVRKMSTSAIKERWGDAALPGPIASSPGSSTQTIDVYVWANHEWSAVVIPHKDDPKVVQKFEHRFHRSPYSLAEADIAADNDRGIRWPGSLYPVWYMIDTFDEYMSDFRENHRDNTRTPRLVKLNRDSYPPDQLATGRPESLTIEDGMAMWSDEEIVLAPIAQVNAESMGVLQEVKQLIQQIAFRPVERAELQPNQSQNLFSTAVQVSERRFNPIMRAISEQAESVVKRLFASVERMGEEVPLYPGYKKKGMISVGPEDVKGWADAVYARTPRAIPLDMNVLASTAERYSTGLGVSLETVYEQILNIEHPAEEIRKGRLQKYRTAIDDEVIIPAMIARLQGAAAELTPEEMAALQELMGTASPDLQEFLMTQGMAPPPMGGMPPEMMGAPPPPEMGGMPPPGNGSMSPVALSNMRRTGVPLQNQLPGEPTVGP